MQKVELNPCGFVNVKAYKFLIFFSYFKTSKINEARKFLSLFICLCFVCLFLFLWGKKKCYLEVGESVAYQGLSHLKTNLFHKGHIDRLLLLQYTRVMSVCSATSCSRYFK